jgi:Sulfotransferase family
MIVCHQYRFVYLGLPKTGSTSLAIALSRYCGPADLITKISAADEAIRRELGYPGPQNDLRPWHQYPIRDLVLAWTRGHTRPMYKHPRASVARRFLGKELWHGYYKFCIERNPFDRAISRFYFDSRNRSLPDINEYVCSLDRRVLSNWSRYTINNRMAVDYVGRYENLEAELAVLAGRLGVPEIVLPAVRTKGRYRPDRQHYSRVLNAASRRHIEKLCASEIEMFAYHWCDEPGPATSSGLTGRDTLHAHQQPQ